MCGILGCVSNDCQKDKFNEALKLLEHRGPDNINLKNYIIADRSIFLGHTRLSIIDLDDEANQPFCIGDYTIVFNGEIYNYKDIKKTLEKDGVKFKTKSDTEVILQSYIAYGIEETLKFLHGMFAFAIYDKTKQKIIICRDRIGIKPLYYLSDDEKFIFSSEIKSIKTLYKNVKINNNSAANYFYHKYVPEIDTIYNEIKALESGSYLIYDLEKNSKKKEFYWQLNISNNNQNEKEVIDRLDELLNESVKEHLVSDVPISFALSGGVDSSLLIAIAKQYKDDIVGFTIKRDENDIDWIYSQKIAKHLRVEQRIIDFQNLQMAQEDKRLYEIYDQPIACSSIFSTYLLFKEISKEFKVSISGDGADEIFGGYMWYKRFLDMKNPSIKLLFDKNNYKRTIRDFLTYFKDDDITRYKKIMLDRFSKKDVEEFLDTTIEAIETDMYKKYIDKIENIKDMMYVDFFTFLRFALIRADLSSMAHSVENRVPFLDHRIVEYAFSIDQNLLYKNGELKYILKKVAERYLPKEYIYRQKRGFSAPVTDILPVSDANEHMIYIYNQWKKYHND